jgi:chromosome segregation ATPase
LYTYYYYHNLQEKLRHLQSEVVEMGMRKSVGKEELKDLYNEIETAQEKLDLVNKAFKVKYEELTEACS